MREPSSGYCLGVKPVFVLFLLASKLWEGHFEELLPPECSFCGSGKSPALSLWRENHAYNCRHCVFNLVFRNYCV